MSAASFVPSAITVDETSQSRERQFLARARNADDRAAVASDPETKATWSDIASMYRGLAALVASKPGQGW